MRILFATWPAVDYQARVLTEMGAGNRLVSFFFSKDMKHSSFKQYCQTGIGIYTKREKKADPLKDAEELAASAPDHVEAEVLPKKRGKHQVVEEDFEEVLPSRRRREDLDDEIPF